MSNYRERFDAVLDGLIASGDQLFVAAPPRKKASPTDELETRFKAILAFFKNKGRIPDSNARDPYEAPLGVRLEAYKADPEKVERLRPLDDAGLLTSSKPSNVVPASLDDLIAAGDPLLTTPEDHIFEHRHARSVEQRADPDQIAERVPCRDFQKFQPLFDACVADIKNGHRTTVPTNATHQIAVGDMFILSGGLAYIADSRVTPGGDAKNPRLRVIFDNGTESDHLLKSFGKALYREENSRRVQNPEGAGMFAGAEPQTTGRVYLVRTRSQEAALAELKPHMVKIGSTKLATKDRVRNAVNDPTFLLAEAEIIGEFEIKGADPGEVEKRLHAFFARACLNLRLPDRFGRHVDPREWFIIRPETVAQAVTLLFDKRLHLNQYDLDTDEIILK